MPVIHGNWHDFYSLALNFNNGDPMFYMEILVSVFKPDSVRVIDFDQVTKLLG